MKSKNKINSNMKNTDRIFIGACFGMPFGIVGILNGALFGIIFNKILKMHFQN